MTNSDLTDLCAKWQKILWLQDWDVTIRFARQRDLPDNKQGTCSFIMQKRCAAIKILEPNDYPVRDICSEQDIEQCIVHELIHLYAGGFDDNFSDSQMLAEEQMINALAAAFVGRPVS